MSQAAIAPSESRRAAETPVFNQSHWRAVEAALAGLRADRSVLVLAGAPDAGAAEAALEALTATGLRIALSGPEAAALASVAAPAFETLGDMGAPREIPQDGAAAAEALRPALERLAAQGRGLACVIAPEQPLTDQALAFLVRLAAVSDEIIAEAGPENEALIGARVLLCAPEEALEELDAFGDPELSAAVAERATVAPFDATSLRAAFRQRTGARLSAAAAEFAMAVTGGAQSLVDALFTEPRLNRFALVAWEEGAAPTATVRRVAAAAAAIGLAAPEDLDLAALEEAEAAAEARRRAAAPEETAGERAGETAERAVPLGDGRIEPTLPEPRGARPSGPEPMLDEVALDEVTLDEVALDEVMLDEAMLDEAMAEQEIAELGVAPIAVDLDALAAGSESATARAPEAEEAAEEEAAATAAPEQEPESDEAEDAPRRGLEDPLISRSEPAEEAAAVRGATLIEPEAEPLLSRAPAWLKGPLTALAAQPRRALLWAAGAVAAAAAAWLLFSLAAPKAPPAPASAAIREIKAAGGADFWEAPRPAPANGGAPLRSFETADAAAPAPAAAPAERLAMSAQSPAREFPGLAPAARPAAGEAGAEPEGSLWTRLADDALSAAEDAARVAAPGTELADELFAARGDLARGETARRLAQLPPAEREAALDHLLERAFDEAEARRQAGRYAYPAGSSAYDALLAVYPLAPADPRLRAELQDLVDHYEKAARDALQQQRYAAFHENNRIADRIRARKPL